MSTGEILSYIVIGIGAISLLIYSILKFKDNLNDFKIPYTNNKKSSSESTKSDNNINNSSLFKKAWNNYKVMIAISALILVVSLVIFSGNLRMFIIVTETITNFAIFYIFKEDKETLGKAVFIATIVALLFGLGLGALCGVSLYPDNGSCGICGGTGVFQGKRCWCIGR